MEVPIPKLPLSTAKASDEVTAFAPTATINSLPVNAPYWDITFNPLLVMLPPIILPLALILPDAVMFVKG